MLFLIIISLSMILKIVQMEEVLDPRRPQAAVLHDVNRR